MAGQQRDVERHDRRRRRLHFGSIAHGQGVTLAAPGAQASNRACRTAARGARSARTHQSPGCRGEARRGTVRLQHSCCCTAREGKPVRVRRWSATVNGAPTRRHHEPGYLKVRRVPTVETQGPGLGGTPRMRGFPGQGPGSENHAHRPPHPLGASAVGLATLLSAATLIVRPAPAAPRPCRPRSPSSPRPRPQQMAGDPAGRRRQHRRLSSTTANGILALAAAHDEAAAAQSALTYMEANANTYINSSTTTPTVRVSWPS